jgi:hypothetical protein
VSASSGPKGDVVPAADTTARNQQPEGRGGHGRAAGRVEAVATVLLALAAVATFPISSSAQATKEVRGPHE